MLTKATADLLRYRKEHDVISEQLTDLHGRKQNYRLNLKELYLNMVKTDPIHQKAMSWVVKRLWKIGEEVSPDIFPKILDEKNVLFLLKVNNSFFFLFRPIIH